MLNYDDAIELIRSSGCGYAIIDPGASFAMRIVRKGSIGQMYVRADLAETDYAGKMALIAHAMREVTQLREVSIFFIEHQYENNVLIQYGALVGILLSMFSDKLVLERKRTGTMRVKEYGPHICELPTGKKADVIGKQKDYNARKEAACAFARGYLHPQDPAFEHVEKDDNDDVADTVCYHVKILRDSKRKYGILNF